MADPARFSQLARADLAAIRAPREGWGADGRRACVALIEAAVRMIARDPLGPTTRDRSDLLPELRSLHLRHALHGIDIKKTVHVLYYRTSRSASIEIVRVLHEDLDPDGT